MTQPVDQTPAERARAFVIIKELPCDIYLQDGDTMHYVNEFLTPENAAVVCAEFNAVLTAALADERRRGKREGMEEAVKIGKSVIDLLYQSSPAHKKGGQTVIAAIRAEAQEVR